MASGDQRNGANAPAYQQLSDKLRELILSGRRAPGDRLPGEAELCEDYQVSRSTVREAIRLLEAQRLVITTRGTTGGSFVAHPHPDRIATELGTSLDLLVAHRTLSVEQILEARELLEVPAAALAARRRDGAALADLRECIDEGRSANERFHRVLLAASGNPLVEVMTRPLFGVLDERVERQQAPASFWKRVDREHRGICDLVEAKDAAGVAEAMGHHLRGLATVYRRIDRQPA